MKIIAHISPLNRPKTGVGVYTQELLSRLISHPEITDVVGFDGLRIYTKIQLLEVLTLTNIMDDSSTSYFNKLKQLSKQQPTIRKTLLYLRSYWQQKMLKPYAKQGYLYWEPNFITAPYEGKTFPVIYDLSDIQCPQYYTKHKAEWHAKHIPKSVNNATRVQTVSMFSKQQIMQVLNVPEHKIDIIFPGVNESFYPRSKQSGAKVLKKYGLKDNGYILSVSTLEPRKNLQNLFLAWAKLPKLLRSQYPLVLVGKNGWLNEQFSESVKKYQQQNQIILTGYIPVSELPYLYSSSKLFAYLSFYEGYGMPISEAICCGATVLASNSSSMPEAGKKYAFYVDPQNIQAIQQALKKLLQTKVKAKEEGRTKLDYELIKQQYSWDIALQKLLKSFKEPLNSKLAKKTKL